MMDNLYLPVNCDVNVGPMLHHLIPASIITTSSKFSNWLSSRFCQVFCQKRMPHEDIAGAWKPYNFTGEEYIWMDYMEHESDYYKFLHIEKYGGFNFNKSEAVLDLINQILYMRQYAVVYLDRFFLKGNPLHTVSHELTQYIIHGFNGSSRKYSISGFFENNKYMSFEIDEKMLLECLDNEAMLSKNTEKGILSQGRIKSIAIKNFISNYPFNVDKIVSKVSDYFQFEIDESLYYEINGEWFDINYSDHITISNEAIGYRSSLLLSSSIEEIILGKKCHLSYSLLYLNYVHKIHLYKQIQDIYSELNLQFDKSVSEKITQNANKSRLAYLAYIRSGKLKHLSGIPNLLNEIYHIENTFLERFTSDLQKRINSNKA